MKPRKRQNLSKQSMHFIKDVVYEKMFEVTESIPKDFKEFLNKTNNSLIPFPNVSWKDFFKHKTDHYLSMRHENLIGESLEAIFKYFVEQSFDVLDKDPKGGVDLVFYYKHNSERYHLMEGFNNNIIVAQIKTANKWGNADSWRQLENNLRKYHVNENKKEVIFYLNCLEDADIVKQKNDIYIVGSNIAWNLASGVNTVDVVDTIKKHYDEYFAEDRGSFRCYMEPIIGGFICQAKKVGLFASSEEKYSYRKLYEYVSN